MDKFYTVAINSYRANGGGGHLTDGVGLTREQLKERIIKVYEKDLRTLITEWVKAKGVVHPLPTHHWKAVPGLWWKNGRQRSLTLLFAGYDPFED